MGAGNGFWHKRNVPEHWEAALVKGSAYGPECRVEGSIRPFLMDSQSVADRVMALTSSTHGRMRNYQVHGDFGRNVSPHSGLDLFEGSLGNIVQIVSDDVLGLLR